MNDQDRTVEEIDHELAARVNRRAQLREDRKKLKLRIDVSQERMASDLIENQLRIEAQTEAIAHLLEVERPIAEVNEARCPSTLDELLAEGSEA